ncbi:MAG: heparinase II/III family protein, partial [Oscillospiraceae bacterium]|nr:heparinase II/III family protein [Oscillospiraceae bacterium]
ISTRNAPTNTTDTTVGMKYSCPYCGVDIRSDHGSYAWGVSPVSRPWKVQCPDCKRLFPSNDFGSFYELGVDKATGVFSREQAYEKHHELFGDQTLETPGEHGSEQWKAYYGVGNKEGYLYNELYEDKDSTWMVDDGFGWSPRDGVPGSSEKVSSNPKWAPIAVYTHFVYVITDSASVNESYYRVISNLRDAYLYTGDVKYARAGIIILDRFSDLYPSFDLTKTSLSYHNSHGSSNAGKVVGSIWEANISDAMVKAYDAFYPMMDDPWVISYLSEKAAENGTENPKTSGELIRENIENGLLREAMNAVYTRRINGNFGSHQLSGALAAVALDTYPETEEMFDWLCAASSSSTTKVTDPIYPAQTYTTYIKNTGGELLSKYIIDVDRDGFGNEVGSGYNSIWPTETITIAALLARYGKSSDINLMENPKYIKMFNSVIRETMGNGYTLQLGDGGGTASKGLSDTSPEAIQAFDLLDEDDENRIQLAKNIYYTKKGNLDNIYIDIFSDNANLAKEIEDIIEEHGELEFESENMTGFGLAVLRRGEALKSTGSAGADFRGDTWMYYGRTDSSHAHRDMLQLGIDAYGFNFMPDLGYPEATSYDENRWQWIKNTLAHNTVVVDDEYQDMLYDGTPLHYDSNGKVGVIDVEAPGVYKTTDIYRRTAVSVEESDEVSYTIDFFRIKGGDKHTYSFHTQSYMGYTTDDFELVPQVDENGNYVGTYAGADVPYGPDPDGNSKNSNYVCRYPRGYTWLKNVNRAQELTDGSFSVNFKQTDFNKQVSDSKGLNLKFIALNDWKPSEVAITTGYAPRTASNKNVTGLDYMFIHREGNNLDTLFTSVLQPYKGEEYIESAESVALTSDGAQVTDNSAKAVKVTLKNGRCDYIIYSTADNITYSVSDTIGDVPVSFNFRGFVGVYSVNEKGENIYSYVNDGDIIGNITGKAEYVGKVVSFTEELTDKNTITVKIDGDVDLESLENRYIYVENDKVQNGSYRILSASVNAENSLYTDLYLGNTSLIRGYKDKTDFDAGFEYNIAAEQSFRIPLSTVEDFAPEFDAVNENITTSAGSSITVKVNAKSLNGESITYIGTVLPRGASVNSETGVVTWKPDSSQVGESGFM